MTDAKEIAAQVPVAATLEDLKLLPGVTNDFIVEQLGKNVTVDQAQSSWMELQQAEIAKGEKSGVEALQETPVVVRATDPRKEWGTLLNAEMAKGTSRARAVRVVAKRNPELRQAMIDAANS